MPEWTWESMDLGNSSQYESLLLLRCPKTNCLAWIQGLPCLLQSDFPHVQGYVVLHCGGRAGPGGHRLDGVFGLAMKLLCRPPWAVKCHPTKPLWMYLCANVYPNLGFFTVAFGSCSASLITLTMLYCAWASLNLGYEFLQELVIKLILQEHILQELINQDWEGLFQHRLTAVVFIHLEQKSGIHMSCCTGKHQRSCMPLHMSCYHISSCGSLPHAQ